MFSSDFLRIPLAPKHYANGGVVEGIGGMVDSGLSALGDKLSETYGRGEAYREILAAVLSGDMGKAQQLLEAVMNPAMRDLRDFNSPAARERSTDRINGLFLNSPPQKFAKGGLAQLKPIKPIKSEFLHPKNQVKGLLDVGLNTNNMMQRGLSRG